MGEHHRRRAVRPATEGAVRRGAVLRARLLSFAAGLLGLLGSAAAALGGGVSEGGLARFTSPAEGALVLGPTEIRFAVESPTVERIDVYVEGRLVGTASAPEWALTWDAPAEQTGARIAAAVYAGGKLAERLAIDTAATVVDEVLDVVAVELYPVITDRRGAYVQHLTRDDFLVFDRGARVEISTFSAEAQSLNMILLIDRSESMRDKLSAVQAAAAELIDQLEPDDRLALYSFNHQLEATAPLGTDRAEAKSRIATLSPIGGTALYDSVLGVIRNLDAVRGRKVLLVFSDGRDERSLASLARTVETARNRGIILYTVGSGDSTADLEARDDLARMAQESGGEAHLIGKLRDLPKVFSEILADVRAQYALTFSPRSLEPGEHTVIVQLRDASLTVRCRDRYLIEGSGPPDR